MGRKPIHRTPNRSNLPLILVLAIPVLSLIIGLIQLLLPFAAMAGIGYLGYKLATRKTHLIRVNTAQRLQDLREAIHHADSQVKQLEHYLADKEYGQYTVLARQVLPQVQHIQSEATALRDDMDASIYKRVSKKAQEVIQDIELQLDRLDIAPEMGPVSQDEKNLLENAPELLTVYRNIQRDHGVILDKIEQMDNKAELLAIHDNDMNRFKDILEGYLKIKASPKDFYNAQERLTQAKAALEKFDLSLDETLRKLNEQDLKDFDISMRMMEDATNGSDHY